MARVGELGRGGGTLLPVNVRVCVKLKRCQSEEAHCYGVQEPLIRELAGCC